MPELIEAGVSCLKIEGRLKARETGRATGRAVCYQHKRPRLLTSHIVRYLLRWLRPDALASRHCDCNPPETRSGVDAAVFLFSQGPEYVAVTTSLYRRAVDAAWAMREGGAGAIAGSGADMSDRGRIILSQQERWDLQQARMRL